jgi:hypothetical protein
LRRRLKPAEACRCGFSNVFERRGERSQRRSEHRRVACAGATATPPGPGRRSSSWSNRAPTWPRSSGIRELGFELLPPAPVGTGRAEGGDA